MSSQERRGAPRSHAEVPVRIRHDESTVMAQLRSLSRLGALVETVESYGVGTSLELTLELPGTRETTQLRGQVIRVTPMGRQFALAIQFAPLLPAVIARIESFVAQHPQSA